MLGLRFIRPKIEWCQFGSFGFFLMQGTLRVNMHEGCKVKKLLYIKNPKSTLSKVLEDASQSSIIWSPSLRVNIR